MLRALPLIYLSLLLGCQTAAMNDINSPAFVIRSGSKLVLNRELNIPSGKAHVKLQHGEVVGGANEYSVNCQFRVRNLGPQVVPPGVFGITRAGEGQEWVSHPGIMRFYRVLSLKSAEQPDVLKLLCQRWSDPRMGRSISVPDMREALGDYISFEFAQVSQ